MDPPAPTRGLLSGDRRPNESHAREGPRSLVRAGRSSTSPGSAGAGATPVRNVFLTNEGENLHKPARLGPRPDELPVSIAKAPFVGETYSMAFFGGFVGLSQDPSDTALRPAIGWAVSDDAASPSDEAR